MTKRIQLSAALPDAYRGLIALHSTVKKAAAVTSHKPLPADPE